MSGPTNALVDQLLVMHKVKTDAINALRLEADRIASQIRDLESAGKRRKEGSDDA